MWKEEEAKEKDEQKWKTGSGRDCVCEGEIIRILRTIMMRRLVRKT
jgi:hypothetical protein